MPKKAPLYLLLSSICTLSMLVCSGCATYKPAPPDLRANTAAWRESSLRIAPAGKQTTLTWEQLSIFGLFANPDLNKARLKYLSSRHTQQYAGLWDDPSISLNVNRYLKGVQYDRGGAFNTSIPVSGRTTLARRVAEMYTQADLRELQALEGDYLMRLRTLCYVIQITHTKHALMQQRLQQLEQEQTSIFRLHELGETTAADLHAATQRLSDLLKEFQELESQHLDKHLELISMLGLHPDVGDIEIAGALPAGVPGTVPQPGEEALLRHPRLLAAMSTYHTSEAELKLEIRKQYPDLLLGPGWTHEEGNNKLSLEVGFTLPLWNRNREAIARAEGSRLMSRQNAVLQYRELLQQARALTLRQDLARKHCRAEYERLLLLQQATEQQESLYSLGELPLPALASTRHETYARQLAYLDCLAELLEIQVALQNLLSIPDCS